MKINIEEGQVAKAIEGRSHSFKDGETIKFVKYGVISEKNDYYEYVFTNDIFTQWLVKDEFELIKEEEKAE